MTNTQTTVKPKQLSRGVTRRASDLIRAVSEELVAAVDVESRAPVQTAWIPCAESEERIRQELAPLYGSGLLSLATVAELVRTGSAVSPSRVPTQRQIPRPPWQDELSGDSTYAAGQEIVGIRPCELS